MNHKKSAKGQALVFIVVTIVGLIAMTGLTVDVGRTYVDRQSAQTSADDAALAAALAMAKNPSITLTALTNTAKSIAANNGYIDGSTSTITVTNPPGISCNGTASVFDGNDEYINVRINTNVNTYFAPFVGISQMHNCVEATSRSTAGTTGGGGGAFNGAAIVALRPTGTDYALAGSFHLTVNNGNLFSNSNTVSTSDSTGSLTMSGGSVITANSGYGIKLAGTGTAGIPSWYSPSNYPTITNGAPQYSQADIDAMLATIPDPVTTEPAPACSGIARTYSVDAHAGTLADPHILLPGNYASGITTSGGTGWYNMQSGVYCFTGSSGLNVSSTNGVYAPGSDVVLVMNNNTASFSGSSDAFFHSLKVYTTNSSFTIGSGSDLYTDTFRFISSGTGTMSVSGDSYFCGLAGAPLVASIGTRRCDFSNAAHAVPDAFMYFKGGSPTWTAGGKVNLHAPSSGPYTGLLVYLPWSNTTAIDFSGGTSYMLYGTYMAPHSKFTITAGNTSNAFHSQFVGYWFDLSGGAGLNLTYGASENWSAAPATAPVIELIK